jgi:hypothetical protein
MPSNINYNREGLLEPTRAVVGQPHGGGGLPWGPPWGPSADRHEIQSRRWVARYIAEDSDSAELA